MHNYMHTCNGEDEHWGLLIQPRFYSNAFSQLGSDSDSVYMCRWYLVHK